MEMNDPVSGLSGRTRLERLWAESCAALGVPPDECETGAVVAQRVEASCGDASLVQGFAQVLRQVIVDPTADLAAERLRGVLAHVLVHVRSVVLQRVLLTLEPGDRMEVVRAGVRDLARGAVPALAAAAAAVYEEPVSAPLSALLARSSADVERAPASDRAAADAAFRGMVLHLVERWSARALSAAAQGLDPMFDPTSARAGSRLVPEPLRIIQLSIETGALGSIVWGAVAEQAQTEEGTRTLLDIIKRAPPENVAIERMAAQLATPARLQTLLREEPIDFDAVDALVSRMGVQTARPLLEALPEAKQRATRRAIMDRLVKIGPEIGPFVVERLNDPRWYVVRNMLLLLREAKCDVEPAAVERFRTHEDARVRRETIQFQIERPRTRDDAVCRALSDADRNVLRTGLQAARTHLPERAAPILARRVVAPDYPPEFRVLTLYLLGRTHAPEAFEALLAFVRGGRSLLGAVQLAPKSPEMLAALGGLARCCADDPRASRYLARARRSRDEQIRNALDAGSGGR